MRISDAFPRPLFRQLWRPRFDSNDSTLLLELFLARLEHLIVRGFFHAVGNESLTERFFLFIHPRARHSMSSILGDDFPFFLQFQSPFGFFRRQRHRRTRQLTTRLVPIGVRKFIRIALVDQSNLSRARFHYFRGRHTHAVSMQLNLSRP